MGTAGACTSAAATPMTEQALRDAIIIDVRTPAEHQGGHLQGDHNIPVDDVNARMAEILAMAGGKKDARVVVYCASGRRSGLAKTMLEAAGFTNVENAGGFSALRVAHPGVVATPAQ